MPKTNTIIVPIIHGAYIGKFLETLYEHTEPNFYVFVIDQSVDNEAYLKYHDKVHLWIKVYKNLGFAKAHNTGIRLSQTPYITLANDDVEFMDKRWWNGILETFAMDERVMAVNPMSPKEGAFGYGLTAENKDTWQPPVEYVRGDDPNFVYPKKPDGSGLFYKEEFSEEDYDFLLNNHLRYRRGTVVDGICMWFTVFRKDGLEKIGLIDEKFYPGGGEDYDMCARAYSCAWPEERDVCDPKYHWRMVSTSLSWVWHWWGKSKEAVGQLPAGIIDQSRTWNNNDELWQPKFEVWGHWDDQSGIHKPIKRVSNIHIADL